MILGDSFRDRHFHTCLKCTASYPISSTHKSANRNTPGSQTRNRTAFSAFGRSAPIVGRKRNHPCGQKKIRDNAIQCCDFAAVDEGKIHQRIFVFRADACDRFASQQPIVLKEKFSEISFRLESDDPVKHVAKLNLSGLSGD